MGIGWIIVFGMLTSMIIVSGILSAYANYLGTRPVGDGK